MIKPTPARLMLAGLLVLALGLAWGLTMVGVPTQDPTPAQYASEQRHLSVAGWLMGAGAAALVLGVVMAVWKWITGLRAA